MIRWKLQPRWLDSHKPVSGATDMRKAINGLAVIVTGHRWLGLRLGQCYSGK